MVQDFAKRNQKEIDKLKTIFENKDKQERDNKNEEIKFWN